LATVIEAKSGLSGFSLPKESFWEQEIKVLRKRNVPKPEFGNEKSSDKLGNEIEPEFGNEINSLLLDRRRAWDEVDKP